MLKNMYLKFAISEKAWQYDDITCKALSTKSLLILEVNYRTLIANNLSNTGI